MPAIPGTCRANNRIATRRLLRFDTPNLIAEFGGPLVVLVLDRFLHFPPHADQLRPLFAAARRAAGSLADVFRLAVNIHDQRFQLGLEGHVIVRTAEAALAAEFVKSDPAHRTGLLVEVGQFFGRLPDGHLLHLLGQRRGHAPRSGGFTTGRGCQVRTGRGPRKGAVPGASRRLVP